MQKLSWALVLLTFLPSVVGAERVPRAGGSELRAASNHSVSALEFSPDGRVLAIGSYRVVALRDIATGNIVKTLSGVEGPVTSIRFMNAGRLAVGSGTPGKDGVVEIWDTKAGRRVKSLAGHTDLVYGIALRSDARQLASVSYDHLVSLWSLGGPMQADSSPQKPRFLRDHTDAVYGLAYRPGGKQLATAAGDRTIKVWDTESGQRLYTLSESTAEQYAVAFRPDGTQLAAGGADKILRLWNLDPAGTGGTVARSAFAHDGAILHVLYAHNGASLFSCGEDNTVKQWDADTLAERAPFPKQPDWPQSLALSPDDRVLAVGRYDGSVALYDTQTRRLAASVPLSAAHHNRAALYNIRTRRLVAGGGSMRTVAQEGGRAAMRRTQDSAGKQPERIPNASPGIKFARLERPGATDIFGDALSPGAGQRCAAGLPAMDAEIKQQPGNETALTAQPITVPSVVSGVLWNGKAAAPAPSNYYRFAALKGQALVLDVMARRTGSPLDSEIEILDAHGKPIERAVLRAVGQTEITLSDRDNISPGIRLQLRPDFYMGDYILAGRELDQIYTLPKGPDDDYVFRSYRGQRSGLLGTTPEFHTLGSLVYKVEVYPPGTPFAPNGMPLTHLFYRNDDGGPLYGRDSYLEFMPPTDGDYIVRVSDVRQQQGEKFAYQLRVHAPRPDFKISLNPPAVSVPKNGTTIVTVECERYEGWNGEIPVRIEGLPAGFSATDGVIEAGETSALLQISAAPGAANPAMDAPASYRVVATARIDGKQIVRTVEPDNKNRRAAIGAAPSLEVVTDLRDVSLSPGREAAVEVRVTRLSGFKGRVPLDVRNLPYGVRVEDVGLNGVLIPEQETSRKFVLHCEPWVKPQERLFYVTANAEGGTANTARPLTLHIAPAASSH